MKYNYGDHKYMCMDINYIVDIVLTILLPTEKYFSSVLFEFFVCLFNGVYDIYHTRI